MEYFVFGSNLAGRHGMGAALEAVKKHGAIYGQGVGFQGRSYAIPTKGYQMERLPLYLVARYVTQFIAAANGRPNDTFRVTAIGTGLAGFPIGFIAPLFEHAPINVHLPEKFTKYLQEKALRPKRG